MKLTDDMLSIIEAIEKENENMILKIIRENKYISPIFNKNYSYLFVDNKYYEYLQILYSIKILINHKDFDINNEKIYNFLDKSFKKLLEWNIFEEYVYYLILKINKNKNKKIKMKKYIKNDVLIIDYYRNNNKMIKYYFFKYFDRYTNKFNELGSYITRLWIRKKYNKFIYYYKKSCKDMLSLYNSHVQSINNINICKLCIYLNENKISLFNSKALVYSDFCDQTGYKKNKLFIFKNKHIILFFLFNKK